MRKPQKHTTSKITGSKQTSSYITEYSGNIAINPNHPTNKRTLAQNNENIPIGGCVEEKLSNADSLSIANYNKNPLLSPARKNIKILKPFTYFDLIREAISAFPNTEADNESNNTNVNKMDTNENNNTNANNNTNENIVEYSATCADIFSYVSLKYPIYFKISNSMTWKGNIRQLLSKNPQFIRRNKKWSYITQEKLTYQEKELKDCLEITKGGRKGYKDNYKWY